MKFATGAALGVLLTFGTMAAAETYRSQTKSETKTVTTRTTDEERATERDASSLRQIVERRIALLQQQLASVTQNSYSISPVMNRAKTSWTNRSSRLPAAPADSSMTVLGSPVASPTDSTYVWESPSIRGPAPIVTHSNGWTIITPAH